MMLTSMFSIFHCFLIHLRVNWPIVLYLLHSNQIFISWFAPPVCLRMKHFGSCSAPVLQHKNALINTACSCSWSLTSSLNPAVLYLYQLSSSLSMWLHQSPASLSPTPTFVFFPLIASAVLIPCCLVPQMPQQVPAACCSHQLVSRMPSQPRQAPSPG